MSLIISSKFRATLSIIFPAVMATSPVADARTASPAPEEARPTEETVAENLLMAEMDSLVKMKRTRARCILFLRAMIRTPLELSSTYWSRSSTAWSNNRPIKKRPSSHNL